MKKFRCTVCGYVYEGDAAPEKCPLCKAPASKFVEVEEATADGPLVFAETRNRRSQRLRRRND